MLLARPSRDRCPTYPDRASVSHMFLPVSLPSLRATEFSHDGPLPNVLHPPFMAHN